MGHRPDMRGTRPIAPGQMCPTGCELAKQVDLFACSFFERINLLQMMLDELDTFIAADLDQISEKMQISIRLVQDNEQMINRLQGTAADLEAQAEGVQARSTPSTRSARSASSAPNSASLD